MDKKQIDNQVLCRRIQVIKKNTLPFLSDLQQARNKWRTPLSLSPYLSLTQHTSIKEVQSVPKHMLILGEADFSYTVAFVRKQLKKGIIFPKKSIIATELRAQNRLE